MKARIMIVIYFLCFNFISSETTDNNKIGLVLSGGGAKGFAHIGLLKVLDEEKIPIDYVVGTSMGSIIGALYSMGYSALEIENIVLTRDWLSYFDDTIARKNELIENKEDKDRYALSLLKENWRLNLPKGAVKGQSIDKVLEELFVNAKDIRDFSKLPIPFACVATDAETGKEVVFTKGYLTDGIRASMSLPGLLDPIEIDGKLLLDGGLSNNFPASIALDLGANYLIGQEVLGDLKRKDELNSALVIMDQALAYKRVDVTIAEKKKIDILLLPDTNEYNIFSFSKAKEMIDAGEKAAREKIDQLKKLKNVEKFDYIKSKKLKTSDNFFIENIEISGNKKLDSPTITKMLGIKLPKEMTMTDFNKLIDKLYNSRLFSKVNYKIVGTTLNINIEEEFDKELKVGFNYNETTKGDLFLKIINKGSKLYGNKSSLEFLLGKDEVVKLQNMWYVGPIKKMGISLTTNYSNVENYALMINKNKISDYDVSLFNLDLMIGTFLSNSRMLALGIKKEYLDIESNTIIANSELNRTKLDYELVYLKYLLDSIDDKYFPKEGVYFEGQLSYYSGDNSKKLEFSNYKLKFNKPIKLAQNLTLNIGAEKALINNSYNSPAYIPALGGMYNRQNSIIFWGLHPSEYRSDQISTGFGEFFYKLDGTKYLVARINYASLNPYENYNERNIIGGGIGLGIKTPIGPIQLILSQSNKEDLMGYLNLGYNF